MFRRQVIPAGVIDGVNKTFTLPTAIDVLDVVEVNGATYYGTVSPLSGSAVITLGDAPTVSIYVWYWDTPPAPPNDDGYTFLDLQNAVCAELKIPDGGTAAYPLKRIKDMLNEGYMHVFGCGKRQPYVREGEVSFDAIPDTTVTGGPYPPGTPVIPVDDSTKFPLAGRVLINNDFVDYTGNTGTALTGCSSVQTTIEGGSAVRFCYYLPTLSPSIDSEQIRSVLVQGVTLQFQAPEFFLQSWQNIYRRYTVFDDHLILPLGQPFQPAYMQFFKKIVLMVADDDTPTVIPNDCRKMLVFYATGRLLIADDNRTGWDQYYAERITKYGVFQSGLYFSYLKSFYSKYGRRIDGNSVQSNSVYD